jgi:hypothetical protein
MERPRLRDNRGRRPFELYPIGQIPSNFICEMSKHFSYFKAVGKSDTKREEIQAKQSYNQLWS